MDKDKDKIYYFECMCHSDEHRLVFDLLHFSDDVELYSSIFLQHYENIFKRIWIAVKYIFGYKSKYGHWDCFMMQKEDVPKFKEMLDEFEKLSKEHEKKIL